MSNTLSGSVLPWLPYLASSMGHQKYQKRGYAFLFQLRQPVCTSQYGGSINRKQTLANTGRKRRKVRNPPQRDIAQACSHKTEIINTFNSLITFSHFFSFLLPWPCDIFSASTSFLICLGLQDVGFELSEFYCQLVDDSQKLSLLNCG